MADFLKQGFPTPTAPVLERGGTLSAVWYRLLSSLWKRTGGGGAGNVVFGSGAVAIAATDGFLHIPGGAGAPTGVPTIFPGQTPLYADQTNRRVYAYFTTPPGWVALN